MLEILALTLAATHFLVPLTYYLYAKTKWLPRSWGLRIDENYRPRVTIIIPTYNEAKLIRGRLDNIYEQDYPRELMKLVVIDGASTDGTVEIVKDWASRHEDINLRLIVESVRRGKAHALNQALEQVEGEVVVIADVDASWPKETLKNTLKWFADPVVGAVSCLKKPIGSRIKGVEEDYRQYYNVLRIAESKAYSTPIFHGELAAFRTDLLKKLGGFPTDIGADDSHTATKIALIGFRAIIPEDLWVGEIIPNKGYLWWRVRRAQHLIQHFTKTLKTVRQAPKEFRKILLIESFLHLANPLLLPTSATLLIISALTTHSFLATAILTLGFSLLSIKQYRTWIAQQAYLIIAALRNLRSKEIIWSKQK